MSRYVKAIAAFLGSLATWGVAAFADGHLSPVEAFGLCGVLIATLAVYQVSNDPPAEATPTPPPVAVTADPPRE